MFNMNFDFIIGELSETLNALDFTNNAPDCEPGTESVYREELSADAAGLMARLAELDSAEPTDAVSIVDIEIAQDGFRDVITANAATVRNLIDCDTFTPTVLSVLNRYFDLFNKSCADSFHRLTGCEIR